MSGKNKDFVTLDSTDLFDDSDVDEEISSFLHHYEAKEEEDQSSEKDIEQKNIQKTQKAKLIKCKPSSNQAPKIGQKGALATQSMNPNAKLMKGKINTNQVPKTGQKSVLATKSMNAKLIKSKVRNNQAPKNDQKNVLATKSIGLKGNVNPHRMPKNNRNWVNVKTNQNFNSKNKQNWVNPKNNQNWVNQKNNQNWVNPKNKKWVNSGQKNVFVGTQSMQNRVTKNKKWINSKNIKKWVNCGQNVFLGTKAMQDNVNLCGVPKNNQKWVKYGQNIALPKMSVKGNANPYRMPTNNQKWVKYALNAKAKYAMKKRAQYFANTKSNQMTQVSESTPQIAEIKKNVKKTKLKKVQGKNFKNKHTHMSSNYEDIVVDDFDSFITGEDDTRNTEVQADLGCSPVSSIDSELYDDSDLEDDIHSELYDSTDLEELNDSTDLEEDMDSDSFVSMDLEEEIQSFLSNESLPLEDVYEPSNSKSIKGETNTSKTEVLKTCLSKDQVENEKFEELNEIQIKSQKDAGVLKSELPKSNHVEIEIVSKQIKGSFMGVDSSEKNIQSKTTYADNSKKEMTKIQKLEGESLKPNSKKMDNSNRTIIVPQVQDSKSRDKTLMPTIEDTKKNAQHAGALNKGRDENKSALSSVKDTKKEAQQTSASRKIEVKPITVPVIDIKNDARQPVATDKGKAEVKPITQTVEVTKKETQQPVVSNTEKADIKPVIVSTEVIEKETQKPGAANKGKADIIPTTQSAEVTKKETQQPGVANKGKADIKPMTRSAEVTKKETQQPGVANKGKADIKPTTPSDVTKKETQQPGVANKGKADVKPMTQSAEVTRKETQKPGIANKGKADIKPTTQSAEVTKETQPGIANKGKADITSTTPSKVTKKETQQTGVANKGKADIKLMTQYAEVTRKETQQPDAANKGKADIKPTTPSVELTKKETQQPAVANKRKADIKPTTQSAEVTKKEMQQPGVANKGKADIKPTTSSAEVTKKETQQPAVANKEKADIKPTTQSTEVTRKETQQPGVANKGKADIKPTTPSAEVTKKETQQPGGANKGKADDKLTTQSAEVNKKESQELGVANKGKANIKPMTASAEVTKKETWQPGASNKGKTEVKLVTPSAKDTISKIDQVVAALKRESVVTSITISVEDAKKKILQSGTCKEKAEISFGTQSVDDNKKERLKLVASNKGNSKMSSLESIKKEIQIADDSASVQGNTAVEAVTPSKDKMPSASLNKENAVKSLTEDIKAEMPQVDELERGKAEIKSAMLTMLESSKKASQQTQKKNLRVYGECAPELGIPVIIGGYEKPENVKFDQEKSWSEGNKFAATAAGTKEVNKRELDGNDEEYKSKKLKKGYVTPSEYEKQVESKMNFIRDKLKRPSAFILNKYEKECLMNRNILRNNGLICDLDEMRKCPSNEWMPTICSFVIGIGRQSSNLTVGFKIDDFDKELSTSLVNSISEVSHNYPDHVIGAAKVFEKMIQVHNCGKGEPHPQAAIKIWKELHIYTNKKQQMMLIIIVSADSSITDEIYNLYADFFKNGEGRKFRVTSVYVACCHKFGRKFWCEHLNGNQNLELMRDLYVNFVGHIEPWSNMYGFKLLCRAVEELLMPTRNTTVLEIFCSTGLLGQYLSKIAGEVLAYDSPSVVKAATKIASNTSAALRYFSGDSRDFTSRINAISKSTSVSAVMNWYLDADHPVDPCQVLKILREIKKIHTLVVVATSKTLSLIPFRTLCAPFDLCKPFLPVKAIPVDTMPLQDGCTVVVLFKRRYEPFKQEHPKFSSRVKAREEWWNWINDDDSKDRCNEDEEKRGRRSNDERRYDDRRYNDRRDDDRKRRRYDEEEMEKKRKLEEQMKKIIHGELDKRRQKQMRKDEGGDRRRKRDDDEYLDDRKDRRISEVERNRKMKEDEEDVKRKQQVEEEMKRKLQAQLDLKRLQEMERIKKEQEEIKRKEEEERKKKEIEEKEKRLSFLRKRLKVEQRRRAHEDQKVEIEKEQTADELVKKRKKEEEEDDQKKLTQMKFKKKQLEKEEKETPLEELRRHIEHEKERTKRRAAERWKQAQVEEKKRNIDVGEGRQQLLNQRIPVWKQTSLEASLFERRDPETRWTVQEEAFKKVEDNKVVFDYNHSRTTNPAIAKQTEVESSTKGTPSNAVSRPVMKWLEKLREVSSDANVQQNSTKQEVSPAGNMPAAHRPFLQDPVAQQPPLMTSHMEKLASSLGGSLASPSLQSLFADKLGPCLPSSLSENFLTAPIRPLLQPPGFVNVSGSNDLLLGVRRSNVDTSNRASSRPPVERFDEQKSLSSVTFGRGHDNLVKSNIPYGEQQGLSNIAFTGQNVAYGGGHYNLPMSNLQLGAQQGSSNFSGPVGLSSVAFGGCQDNLIKSNTTFGENQSLLNVALAGQKGLSSVTSGHSNSANSSVAYGKQQSNIPFGEYKMPSNIGFGDQKGLSSSATPGSHDDLLKSRYGESGYEGLRRSHGASSVSNVYGFAGSGIYDDQVRNSEVSNTDVFSFKKTLHDMKNYGSSYGGQGKY